MSARFQKVAVALPLVLLALMVARAEMQLADSTVYYFEIQGYDPRDLLRGHYMRFRLAVTPVETLESCAVGSADCCYCLEPGPAMPSLATLATCQTAAEKCEDFVRTEALHALDRFYIPEEGRRQMERNLRDAARHDRAHLAVAVSSSGEPLIQALLVDGVPITAERPPDDGAASSQP